MKKIGISWLCAIMLITGLLANLALPEKAGAASLDVQAGDIVIDNSDGAPRVAVSGSWDQRNPVVNPDFWVYGPNAFLVGPASPKNRAVTYTPARAELAPGRYEISICYSAFGNRDKSVPVDIYHDGVVDTLYVDQRINGSQWFSLGQFEFNGDGTEYVRIKNEGTTNYVVADAVRFAPVGAEANADLSGLTISSGILAPSFKPYVTQYTLSVNYDTDYIQVTPTVSSSTYHSVTVDGVPAASGSPTAVTIQAGRYLTIAVTAADGLTTKTYQIEMVRKLDIEPGDFVVDNSDGAPTVAVTGTWDRRNPVLNPTFWVHGSNAFLAAPTYPKNLAVTYTPAQSALAPGRYAVYICYAAGGNRDNHVPVEIYHGGVTDTVFVNQRINGSEWFQLGEFDFYGDGTEYVRIKNEGTTNYVVADAVRFATVEAPLDQGYLSGLAVSPGALTPAFNPFIPTYNVEVYYETEHIAITPAVSASTYQSVTVNGAPALSGEAATVPLQVGSNLISVVVTTADGTVAKTYNLHVTRPEDPLPGFTLRPTGPVSQANVNWIATSSTEANVRRLLNGNIAFVAGHPTAWVYDGKVQMSAPANYNGDGTFSVPADFAASALGVQTNQSVISTAQIADSLGLHSFYDDRGFLLLSTNPDVVKMNIIGGDEDSFYADFYHVAGAMGQITWEDVDPTEADYQTYIRNMKAQLTYTPDEAAANASYAAGIIATAKVNAGKVNRDPGALSPFTDITIPQTYSSAQFIAFEGVYERIYNMASGFYMQYMNGVTDEVLKDAILYSLQFMHEKYYYPDSFPFNQSARWTTFQFLIPNSLSNTLYLMEDVMSAEDIQKYVYAMFDKSIDPTKSQGTNAAHYYTNRLWLSSSFFNGAMLIRDKGRVNYALRNLNQVFDYVSRDATISLSSNGFYEDGSMVFHNNFPYNLGYGRSYVNTLAELLLSTQGTSLDIRSIHGYDRIYAMLTDSYLPFVVRNQSMPLVLGRGKGTDATLLMRSIMIILNFAPADIKYKVSRQVKSVLADYLGEYDPSSINTNGRFSSFPVHRKQTAEYLTYLEGVAPHAVQDYNKIYYNMDRAVHEREDFRFGLSMSSERIGKYEGYNTGQGLDEWYIGDGMTYIHTDDRSQYTQTWWDKADPYYMPGTTVDSTPRAEVDTRNTTIWGLPENAYAGGTSDGTYGVAGMILGNQWISGLAARKSWFMLDHEIVNLGTGITGGQGRVYTAIDNRYISKPLDSLLETVDIVSMTDYANTDLQSLWNIADNDYETNWRNQAIDSWIQFDFGQVQDVAGIAIAFNSGNQRKAKFHLLTSTDGVNFTDSGEMESSGDTTSLEFFAQPGEYRYLRFQFKGNNTSSGWINIPEVAFYTGDPDEIRDRMNLPQSGAEAFVIDGVEVALDFNITHQVSSPSWAWNERGMGYVFLSENELSYKRSEQSGYVTFIHSLEHGVQPNDAEYAYVLLPSYDAQQTAAYAAAPNAEIIRQDNAAHAVRDRSTGLIMANVFESTVLEGITFSGPASVIIKPDSTGARIYISDPTQKQGTLQLTFPAGTVVEDADNVTGNGNTAIINTGKKKGSTFSFHFTHAVN